MRTESEKFITIAEDLFKQAQHVALKEGVLIAHSTPRFNDPINEAVDIVDEALEYVQRATEAGHDTKVIEPLQMKLAGLRNQLVGSMEQ